MYNGQEERVAESIRIIFLADSHLGFDYPVRPKIERRRRGDDFFANFGRVLEYAVAAKPDMVVHGGDLFFRSRVPPKIVDMVYAELASFARSGIPLLIVPGNHERSKLPDSLWLSQPNIYVFDRPTTFHLQIAEYRVAVAGFPFVRDNIRGDFGDVLNRTGWKEQYSDVRLLCMHQAVEGASVGPGQYTFRSAPDVVKMADIPTQFVAVLSGHIHRRQILGSAPGRRQGRVIYAGSIERTSFAEKDEPKGFFEIQVAKQDNGRWQAQRIDFRELPSRPMVDITVDRGQDLRILRANLLQQVEHLDPNSVVRLRGAGDGVTAGGLSTSFFRSVFPPTMNVELTASLYVQPAETTGDVDE